jgi:hypothetical protein
MPGPCYYEATVNIALNEDWVVPFIYGSLNADGTITPIDLTGSELKLEIRVNETDHEAMVSVFSPDHGINFWSTGPTSGGFTIAITRDLLARLYPGAFAIDFVRLLPNGYQERIWAGTATVVEGTTR